MILVTFSVNYLKTKNVFNINCQVGTRNFKIELKNNKLEIETVMFVKFEFQTDKQI